MLSNAGAPAGHNLFLQPLTVFGGVVFLLQLGQWQFHPDAPTLLL